MQRKKNHNSIDGMSSRPATRFGQPVNRSNFQSQGQIRAFSDTKKLRPIVWIIYLEKTAFMLRAILCQVAHQDQSIVDQTVQLS